MDSYMYQTVGHSAISLYAEAMDLPLYRATIRGSARASDKEYSPTDGDEVEDLHRLLSRVKVGAAEDCEELGDHFHQFLTFCFLAAFT